MATKIFEVGIMASEDIQSYVGSCKFKSGTAYANVSDGAFVTLGDLCVDGTYSNMKDWNCYEAKAPTATTLNREDIVAIDISAVSEGVINENSYKIGVKLCNLEVKAGYAARFRRLAKGDKFWLGRGNFTTTTAPTVGEYAILTANDTILTASSSTPANFGVKILATKPFILGSNVKGVYGTAAAEDEYLVEVL